MNEQKTLENLLTDLKLPYTVDSIKEFPFEFVKCVCAVYDEDNSADKFSDTGQLLKLLPSICFPKELLLALLEEANSFKTFEKFEALLGPIHECLLLITNKRHKSVVLAFDTLCAHIECESLQDSSVDCIESLDIIQFPDALEQNITLFLSHFKAFVLNVNVEGTDCSPLTSAEIFSLSLIFLKLYARPLAYKRWNFNAGNSEMFCLNLFHLLQKNGVKFLAETLSWKSKNDSEWEKLVGDKFNEKIEIVKSEDSSENSEKITWDVECGLGTLAYALFNDQYNGNLIPQIYTPSYLFLTHLNLISHLLNIRRPNSHPADKGCALIMYFLKRIGTSNLDGFTIDHDGMKKLVKKLMEMSTTSNVKEISQKCLACLNALIWCYKPNGRIELLNFILHNTTHSGLLGFIVTALKNQVDESFKSNDDNHFNRCVLEKLICTIFRLYIDKKPPCTDNILTQSDKKSLVSDKGKFNILDDTDRIMSCLNFLRYLLLKNNQKSLENSLINLKNLLPIIKSNFLEPLRTELINMRSNVLKELSYLQNKPEKDFLTSVTVGNETLDNISPQDKSKMAHVVLTNIDLIESVLVRTETLISNPSDGCVLKFNPKLEDADKSSLKVEIDNHIVEPLGSQISHMELSPLARNLNSRISPLL